MDATKIKTYNYVRQQGVNMSSYNHTHICYIFQGYWNVLQNYWKILYLAYKDMSFIHIMNQNYQLLNINEMDN